MAEKRKPNVTFLLRYPGKKNAHKIELFPATEFAGKVRYPDRYLQYRYRIRANGKWYSRVDAKYSFYTKWEFRDILWKSLSWQPTKGD
jgi:hypothetical protein